VAEGVLLCEDVLAVPVEVLVRNEALREDRNCEPRSVTEEAMLCLLPCLRLGGVECNCGILSYSSAGGGGVSSSLLVDAGGRLSVGGVVDAMRETEEVDCLCPLLFAPPNREGRREKRPPVLDLSMACTSPQPLVEPYYGRLGGPISGTFRGRVSTLQARRRHDNPR
jgi:hypothetical protein